MKTVLVPLAPGCEEIEAITIIDILRRAGVAVVSAGLSTHIVNASRGVRLEPDTTLDEALSHEYDMVVLPGGQPGTHNLTGPSSALRSLSMAGNTTCRRASKAPSSRKNSVRKRQ